jgi:uncharacterized membrane protein affecting hemolysin expression
VREKAIAGVVSFVDSDAFPAHPALSELVVLMEAPAQALEYEQRVVEPVAEKKDPCGSLRKTVEEAARSEVRGEVAATAAEAVVAVYFGYELSKMHVIASALEVLFGLLRTRLMELKRRVDIARVC